MPLVTNVLHGGGRDRLLLLAHGYGANEADLGGLLSYLDPEGRFVTVLPRGPVDAPPGYSWYEVMADPDSMAKGFAAALEQLDDLLDESCAEYGLARDEAVVGGFSQGAGLMLALALQRGERPRPKAVLVMSGFLPRLEDVEFDWESDRLVPVLVQHGTRDPLIPVSKSRELAKMLADHDVPVVYREYPIGHEVALESVRDAKEWLDQVVSGDRPRESVEEIDEVAVASNDDGLVKAVTTSTFDAEVLSSDLPVIVDFWAVWCAPCRQVSPIVEQIAAMREGSYKVVKVNIDEEPQLAQRFEVQSIPMIGLFRNGRLERSVLGAKPRPQIESELGMLIIP